jgi:kinesin family protein 5
VEAGVAEKARRAVADELATVKERTGRSMTEFETLRTALMRDLQNRCEKVIDLEMALDEAREVCAPVGE